MTDFILLGSIITSDDDCSHEFKRQLLLERKALANQKKHIKKQRHHFANNDPIVKTIVLPVVMYRCKSWTINKASSKELMSSNCGAGEDS